MCSKICFFRGLKVKTSKKFITFFFNLTVLYSVLRFHDKRIKFEAARAFLKQFWKINSLWKMQFGILTAYEFGETKEVAFGETKAPPKAAFC